jgi:O-antigen ligase
MREMQDAKAKGAMSMLALLLFLGLAATLLLGSEAFRNLLKLLVIALVLVAGLAAAAAPQPIGKTEEGRPPAPAN